MQDKDFFAEIPIGFGMQLAKDVDAMNVFSSMDESRRRQVIAGAKQVQSKREMEEYVDRLAGKGDRWS